MGIKSKTNFIIKIIIQTIDNYNKLMMILNLKILKMVKMKINVKKIQKTLVVWILKVMNAQEQMILKMKMQMDKMEMIQIKMTQIFNEINNDISL